MKNKETKRAVDTARKWNVFRPAIEAGFSPAEIKKSIIELLDPYFYDKSLLHQFAVGVLAGEAFRVARIKQDQWTAKAFDTAIAIYRAAESVNPAECYKACAESEKDILAAAPNHWSHLYLELDKADLPLEEFRHEAFRNIGALVESYLFPHLRDLLMQVRLKRSKNTPYSAILRMKLGNVVNELHSTIPMPEIVAPAPWKIHVNQWRNIAQHHRSCVRGQVIHGYYGEPPNEREVILTRDELWGILVKIYSICEVVNTARTLFVIDNIKRIETDFPEQLELREDAFILSIATAVSTQGFELADLHIEDESIEATVVELTDGPPEERRIHASQFVYPLWCKFQKNTIVLRYLDREYKLRLTTKAKGSDCKRIADGEIDFSELAALVKFEIGGEKVP